MLSAITMSLYLCGGILLIVMWAGVGTSHFKLDKARGSSPELLASDRAPVCVYTILEVQLKHTGQVLCYRCYGAALVNDTARVACFSFS